jgi:hypothetical protein
LAPSIMYANYQAIHGTHCSPMAIELGIPKPVVEFRDPVLQGIVFDPLISLTTLSAIQ